MRLKPIVYRLDKDIRIFGRAATSKSAREACFCEAWRAWLGWRFQDVLKWLWGRPRPRNVIYRVPRSVIHRNEGAS